MLGETSEVRGQSQGSRIYSLIFSFLLFLFSSPAVTEAGKAGDSLAQDFFREEYMLNNAIGLIFRFTPLELCLLLSCYSYNLQRFIGNIQKSI